MTDIIIGEAFNRFSIAVFSSVEDVEALSHPLRHIFQKYRQTHTLASKS